MLKIVFRSKEILEEELGWMRKKDGTYRNTTICNECLEVDPDSLEVVQAHGYDNLIGRLLQEGKIRIKKI